MQAIKKKALTQEERLPFLFTLQYTSFFNKKNLFMIKNSFLLFLLAISFGMLLTLAFAPFNFFALSFLMPLGLLSLLHQASAKKAFYIGFCFGLGCFGAGLYWVYISIHVFGNTPVVLALLLTALLMIYLAIFPAAACYFSNRYFSKHPYIKHLYIFPIFWVASEWMRGWLFTGFPWLFIGYSQSHTVLKNLAPIIGIYGISWVLLLSVGIFYNTYLYFKSHKQFYCYTHLLAFISIWSICYGLGFVQWSETMGETLKVSLVQGNIPQTLKWSPKHLQLSFDRYAALSEPLWGKSELIIWPEAAIPLGLNDARDFIKTMEARARESGSTLILGIPIEDKHSVGYFNGLISLGSTKQYYFKRRLVPFGEYIPFESIAKPIFNVIDIPIANLLAGQATQTPLLLHSTQILSSICYEIAFPELIRQAANKDIGLLLTITNDAWFGRSIAQAQHLQIAMMRALEFNKPLIFASNDGISALISPRGEIMATIPPYQTNVLTTEVKPMIGMTPWMQMGTTPLFLFMLTLLVYATRLTRKKDPGELNYEPTPQTST